MEFGLQTFPQTVANRQDPVIIRIEGFFGNAVKSASPEFGAGRYRKFRDQPVSEIKLGLVVEVPSNIGSASEEPLLEMWTKRRRRANTEKPDIHKVIFRIDGNAVRDLRHGQDIDDAAIRGGIVLGKRASNSQGVRNIQQRGFQNAVVLENAPLNICFLPDIAQAVELAFGPSFDQLLSGLVQKGKTVS